MKELYELKEQLMDVLKEYRGKQRKSMDDITAIKYLASSIDHIGNIIENAEGEEYSMRGGQGGYYARTGRVYDGHAFRNSYRRDSMGRYSREGLADKLHELMDEAPDEKSRMEIQRLIDKM